jgi:dTDP-glucose 4,6-dehydratase
MLKTRAMDGGGFLKKYIAISTPEVYGVTGAKMKESTDFKPSTPYAISKLAGDLHLSALHRKEGFPVVFTRSANVYGLHQQLHRIIPTTIVSLKKGEQIRLNNAGKSVRSFIHARDLADATWRAITFGKTGEVYHLSPDGEGVTIKDVVKLICERMNCDFESSVALEPENKWRDSNYDLDSSKARTELNWKPSVKLEDGIEETISWIDDNWDKLKFMPTKYVHKE